MISDLDCAKLCRALEQRPGDPVTQWDYVSPGGIIGAAHGIKDYGDFAVLAFRGSLNLWDWLHDLTAWTLPVSFHSIGPVHPGFMTGVAPAITDLRPIIATGKPIVVTGHSLGAARAEIAAALLTLAKVPVIARICFGSPKPAFAKLGEILKDIPGRSYRNGHPDLHEHDIITNLPFTFPPEEYVHPGDMIDVYAVPPADDTWGPFRYHHSELYIEALEKLTASGGKPS